MLEGYVVEFRLTVSVLVRLKQEQCHLIEAEILKNEISAPIKLASPPPPLDQQIRFKRPRR